jgi:hypothetical protein
VFKYRTSAFNSHITQNSNDDHEAAFRKVAAAAAFDAGERTISARLHCMRPHKSDHVVSVLQLAPNITTTAVEVVVVVVVMALALVVVVVVVVAVVIMMKAATTRGVSQMKQLPVSIEASKRFKLIHSTTETAAAAAAADAAATATDDDNAFEQQHRAVAMLPIRAE